MSNYLNTYQLWRLLPLKMTALVYYRFIPPHAFSATAYLSKTLNEPEVAQ